MRSLELGLTPSKIGRPITLHVLSCTHVGHSSHDRERTLELLETVRKTPDHYLVNLGDTGDNGTKTSPGASVYEQQLNPREQAIAIAVLFRPLVDAGKVLWWHDSNHSVRTYRDTGFFTMEETLAKLFFGDGVTDDVWRVLERYAAGGYKGRTKSAVKNRVDAQMYLEDAMTRIKPAANPLVKWAGWQAITKLRAGKQTYMIHSMHGEGAGVAPSSALSAVTKQRDIGEADIYLRGHHHKKIATDACRAYWDARGKAKFKRIGFLTTGCYLGYHDSYGEAKGYPPNALGASRVVLSTGDDWGFELRV